MLNILHEAVARIVPELGGEGGSAKGRRSARGAGRGDRWDKEGEGDHQQQGQADLPIRNAFKMSVYLLFSAAFPSEECYSSAKQVCALRVIYASNFEETGERAHGAPSRRCSVAFLADGTCYAGVVLGRVVQCKHVPAAIVL